MTTELVFTGGSSIMKIRVSGDKKIYAASPKTGLQNFIPHTISRKGIEKAKEKRKWNKDEISKAEKEIMEDEKWIEEHSVEEIIKEIKKELAKSGFRMRRRQEI